MKPIDHWPIDTGGKVPLCRLQWGDNSTGREVDFQLGDGKRGRGDATWPLDVWPADDSDSERVMVWLVIGRVSRCNDV